MPGFGVADLRSKIGARGGFAFGNKYKVIIPKPPIMGGSSTGGSDIDRHLSLMCETAALPTRGLATGERKIHGAPFKIPYSSTYTEVAMSFFLTDRLDEKSFFDEWQAKIVDPVTNNMGFYKDYVTQVVIAKLSSQSLGPDQSLNEKTDYIITLVDAWPGLVGEVGLSHAGGAEILKLSVTMYYHKWVRGHGGRIQWKASADS